MNTLEYEWLIDDTGVMETETQQVSGKLKVLILESDKPISINMFVENYPDITILDIINFSGCKYFNIRCPVSDKAGNVFNYESDYFHLQDELKIIIKGMANTKVKLKIRWDE